MSLDMEDCTRMLETMAIAEPVPIGDQVEWKERSRAILMTLPVAPGVTTLPPFRQESSLNSPWLM